MILKQKRMGTGRESKGEWREEEKGNRKEGEGGGEEGNVVFYQQANKYTNYFKR